MRKLSIPSLDHVAAGRKDHFLTFDTPAELADYAQEKASNDPHITRAPSTFFGPDTGEQALKKARSGDLAGVAASDALLEKFERFTFETSRKAWADDVCGSIPNVPAFIAGHPLAMRRRIRQDSASAPVAIVADLTTSAALTADQIARRGAAILALVRILSARRPVELWAGCIMNARAQGLSAIFCRIETTPLDLATAAYVMTSASFPRRLCYGLAAVEHGFTGLWPYSNDYNAPKKHGLEIIRRALDHVTEALYVPPIHSNDLITTDPQAWIEARLSELSPVDLAA